MIKIMPIRAIKNGQESFKQSIFAIVVAVFAVLAATNVLNKLVFFPFLTMNTMAKSIHLRLV